MHVSPVDVAAWVTTLLALHHLPFPCLLQACSPAPAAPSLPTASLPCSPVTGGCPEPHHGPPRLGTGESCCLYLCAPLGHHGAETSSSLTSLAPWSLAQPLTPTPRWGQTLCPRAPPVLSARQHLCPFPKSVSTQVAQSWVVHTAAPAQLPCQQSDSHLPFDLAGTFV